MIKSYQASLVIACIGAAAMAQNSWAFDLSNSLAAGGEKTYTTTGLSKNSMNYRVFLPDGYDSSKTYSVILYLNSAAERDPNGTTNAIFNITNLNGDGKVVDNPWVKALLNETMHSTDHQAIVITPQSGWYQYWSGYNNGDSWNQANYTNSNAPAMTDNEKLAMGILNSVIATYNHGDTSNVVLTGPSMGGWGAWDLSSRYPNSFSKVVALSGGGNITAASSVYTNKEVWAFHGKADNLIDATHTEQLIAAIRASGKTAYFTEPTSVGHGGWDTFYTDGAYFNSDGLSLYDWMIPTPEPASLGLLAIGSLALLRRKVAH